MKWNCFKLCDAWIVTKETQFDSVRAVNCRRFCAVGNVRRFTVGSRNQEQLRFESYRDVRRAKGSSIPDLRSTHHRGTHLNVLLVGLG